MAEATSSRIPTPAADTDRVYISSNSHCRIGGVAFLLQQKLSSSVAKEFVKIYNKEVPYQIWRQRGQIVDLSCAYRRRH